MLVQRRLLLPALRSMGHRRLLSGPPKAATLVQRKQLRDFIRASMDRDDLGRGEPNEEWLYLAYIVQPFTVYCLYYMFNKGARAGAERSGGGVRI